MQMERERERERDRDKEYGLSTKRQYGVNNKRTDGERQHSLQNISACKWKERERERENIGCQQKGNMGLTIRGQMDKGNIHFRVF